MKKIELFLFTFLSTHRRIWCKHTIPDNLSCVCESEVVPSYCDLNMSDFERF